jgi:hypothetical protein
LNLTTFEEYLTELYQGEIIGEVIFDQMLSFFPDEQYRYKISVLLQLETETKARLRPILMQRGLNIAELDSSRETAFRLVQALEGKSWEETMAVLESVVKGAVVRYKEIAACAPEELQEVTQLMVDHELSLAYFIQEELAGDPIDSLSTILPQLIFKPIMNSSPI